MSSRILALREGKNVSDSYLGFLVHESSAAGLWPGKLSRSTLRDKTAARSFESSVFVVVRSLLTVG